MRTIGIAAVIVCVRGVKWYCSRVLWWCVCVRAHACVHACICLLWDGCVRACACLCMCMPGVRVVGRVGGWVCVCIECMQSRCTQV